MFSSHLQQVRKDDVGGLRPARRPGHARSPGQPALPRSRERATFRVLRPTLRSLSALKLAVRPGQPLSAGVGKSRIAARPAKS